MTTERRLPTWFKVKMPSGPNYSKLHNLIKTQGLNTVCEEASCPNTGECWALKHATMMIIDALLLFVVRELDIVLSFYDGGKSRI